MVNAMTQVSLTELSFLRCCLIKSDETSSTQQTLQNKTKKSKTGAYCFAPINVLHPISFWWYFWISSFIPGFNVSGMWIARLHNCDSPQTESVVFQIHRLFAQRDKKRPSIRAQLLGRNYFQKHWLCVAPELVVPSRSPNDWIHQRVKLFIDVVFPSDFLDGGTAGWGRRKKRRVFGTNAAGELPRQLIFFLLISLLPLFYLLFTFMYPPFFSSSCLHNLWVISLFEIV